MLAVYLLGRVTFGRRVGLVAGALALGSDVAIHFSRLGVNNISDMLFMAWTLAALWFAGASGRPWGYVAAGLWWGQIRDSLLVLTVLPDRGSFYHPPQALLHPLLAPVFLLGLVALAAGARRGGPTLPAGGSDAHLAARVPAARPLYFYVFPDRIADLPDLLARFPGGEVTEYRRSTDKVLFLTRYLVP